MDGNTYSAFDTGLHGSQTMAARPVPKPRPRKSLPVDAQINKGVTSEERPVPKPKPRVPTRPDRMPINHLESEISSYRGHVEEMILQNRSQEEKFHAACKVMNLVCSLNLKYEVIDLLSLLYSNQNAIIHKIPMAFTILEKYATNLLKDESKRHLSWRTVQFSSNAFQQKVQFMKGGLDILRSLGYTEEILSNTGDLVGLSYPPNMVPNSRIVSNIAVDLVIAKFEVEAMIMGTHPQLDKLQKVEYIPMVFFPTTNNLHLISTDTSLYSLSDFNVDNKHVSNKKIEDKIKYACNKTVIAENIYDVPPPPVPPKRNQSFKNESNSNNVDQSSPVDLCQQLPIQQLPMNQHQQLPSRQQLTNQNRELQSQQPPMKPYQGSQSQKKPINEYQKNIQNVQLPLNEFQQTLPSMQSSRNEYQQDFQNQQPMLKEYQQSLPTKQPLINEYNTPSINQSEQLTSKTSCFKCNSSIDVNSNFCPKCGSSLRRSLPSENEEPVTQTNDTVKHPSLKEEGPVDEEPGWHCDHCTMLNPSFDTNICLMCHKTSQINNSAVTPSKEKKVEKQNDVHDKSPVTSQYAGEIMPPIKIGDMFNWKGAMFATAPLLPQSIPLRKTLSLNDTPAFKNEEAQYDDSMIREVQRKKEEELLLKRQKEAQLSEAKRHQMIAQQNEMKENARRLVSLMKHAEKNGFTVEECFLASKSIEEFNEQSLINWLQNDWPKLIDDVVKVCIDLFEKEDTLGAISKTEAKELLLEVDGNKTKVVQLFRERRSEKINNMAFLEKWHSKKDIIQALVDGGGDEEKARELLNKKQFEKFLKNIWKKRTPGDYFERLKDENVPEEVRSRIIMAETDKIAWGRSQHFFRLLRENKGDPDLNIGDYLEAVRECQHFEQCKKFLKHYCAICYGDFSHNNIVVGFECQCELCLECYAQHITVTLSEKHIRHLVCSVCFKPNIDGDPSNYYSNLQQQIRHFITKGLLHENILEKFEVKLRDFVLMKHENFRWCLHCGNGFLWDDINNIRITCDKCHQQMCYHCNEKWMEQHDGITCKQFKDWKDANNPELQEAGVLGLLGKNGLECPECHFRYDLARGGCMHFTCTQCGFQFCIGCSNGMRKGGQCTVHPTCANQGLHGHHPRDCLYYLRDSTIEELERLLNNHNIEWDKAYPTEMLGNNNPVCALMEQKEVDTLLKDEECGNLAPQNMAGLCEGHYKEYLVILINRNGVDPVELMDINQMRNEIARHFHPNLERGNEESEEQYLPRLKKYILEKIPLPVRQNRLQAPPPVAIPVLDNVPLPVQIPVYDEEDGGIYVDAE